MRTIRSSSEIEAMFRRGRRVSHPLLLMLFAHTPEGRGPEGRVAVIAGKKVGGAVVRNRAKRLLREAARSSGAPWSGFDVVLIGRPPLLQASSGEVTAALVALLRRANISG